MTFHSRHDWSYSRTHRAQRQLETPSSSRETGARKVSEKCVPLKEKLGRVLRVVLRNAVALARAQAELRELERHVFPQRAVALALVLFHVGVGIVVFVGELEVVALGRLVVAFEERRPLLQAPGRGPVLGAVDSGSEPGDSAGAQARENALHAAIGRSVEIGAR